MARLPFPAAVQSPEPRVVNVVKRKYWSVWVVAGWPPAKNGAPADVLDGRVSSRKHQDHGDQPDLHGGGHPLTAAERGEQGTSR